MKVSANDEPTGPASTLCSLTSHSLAASAANRVHCRPDPGTEQFETGHQRRLVVGYLSISIRWATDILDLRIEADQLDLVRQRGTRQMEQLVEEVWDRQHGRTELERIPALLQCGELAAGDRIAFQHLDLMTRCCEPDRRCQPSDPCLRRRSPSSTLSYQTGDRHNGDGHDPDSNRHRKAGEMAVDAAVGGEVEVAVLTTAAVRPGPACQPQYMFV